MVGRVVFDGRRPRPGDSKNGGRSGSTGDNLWRFRQLGLRRLGGRMEIEASRFAHLLDEVSLFYGPLEDQLKQILGTPLTTQGGAHDLDKPGRGLPPPACFLFLQILADGRLERERSPVQVGIR
ncbi:hypothetical protein CMI37_07615 [Candidatus Pacearchaeota archaeon]|nr:hypothetical protein [Candidatus Pacearchaeota archaeon]